MAVQKRKGEGRTERVSQFLRFSLGSRQAKALEFLEVPCGQVWTFSLSSCQAIALEVVEVPYGEPGSAGFRAVEQVRNEKIGLRDHVRGRLRGTTTCSIQAARFATHKSYPLQICAHVHLDLHLCENVA
jgi:hypothetical protein